MQPQWHLNKPAWGFFYGEIRPLRMEPEEHQHLMGMERKYSILVEHSRSVGFTGRRKTSKECYGRSQDRGHLKKEEVVNRASLCCW